MDKKDRPLFEPHPLNAPGPFYVVRGECIACEAPESEAPDLMSHEREHGHCYFRRQPETPEETERAVRAVEICCCGAVRYAGGDPNILERLKRRRHRQCDALPLSLLEHRYLPAPPNPPPHTRIGPLSPPPARPDRSHPLWDRDLDW